MSCVGIELLLAGIEQFGEALDVMYCLKHHYSI